MKKIIVGIICGLFLGCGVIPHKADFITEISDFQKANIDSNGILAFHIKPDAGMVLKVDFTNKTIGQKFRIDFTPGFQSSMALGLGPITVAEKKFQKNMVSDSIALFTLPPGKYEPWYLYAEDETRGSKFSVSGTGFEILPGVITSIGRIDINREDGFLSIKNVSIETKPGTISDEIKLISSRDFNKRSINEYQISIKKK